MEVELEVESIIRERSLKVGYFCHLNGVHHMYIKVAFFSIRSTVSGAGRHTNHLTMLSSSIILVIHSHLVQVQFICMTWILKDCCIVICLHLCARNVFIV